eukprot:s1206_g12.t1
MDGAALRDDAAGGSPQEAGAILGVLRKVGLTGPRLALQVGEEEVLARQLAERACLEYQPWMHEFVKLQVKEAYEVMELSVRLDGGQARPGIQAVRDATESMEKARRVEAQQSNQDGKRDVPPAPVRGKMAKIPMRGRLVRVATEEEEEEKVLKLVQEELQLVGAPVMEKISGTADPARSQRALLGRYRPSTVRRYLAYWQGFRKWVQVQSGSNPTTSVQLVDYLHARDEEGMGPSVPLSVSKAVSWFENLAGWDRSEWMSGDPFVDVVVKDLLRRLEEGAPPRKRAPRMLGLFIPALEEIISRPGVADPIKVGAWVKLVKIWASLRFDDMAHLQVGMMKSYDGKIAGLMRRTKTTGAGKRVRELPFFVSEEAWIVQQNWVALGLQALGRTLKREFVLAVPAGTSIDMPEETVMSYQEAVAWSSEVMREMRAPDGRELVPEGWERFWTEHSERSTLTSGLAAIGVQKPDRDLLGRWTPEGSDQYVRTYNAAVKRMQHQYAEAVRGGSSYELFDEGTVLEDLKDWLVVKWGIAKEVAAEAVDAWKFRVCPEETFAGMLEKSEVAAGAAEVPKKGPAGRNADSSQSDSDSSSSTESTGAKKRKVERLSEERESGFIVVYNRIDRGKLHRDGKQGCWMAKQRRFKRASVYSELPGPETYTTRCQLCWPTKGDDGSSSDSEDELEGDADVVPEAGVELFSAAQDSSGDLW